MTSSIILVLTGVAAAASVVNLFDNLTNRKKREESTKIPMKVQLPGNLPVIALSSAKGNVMNFLLDSGSNISHICTEYFDDLDAEVVDIYEDGKVAGLGATNIGVTMCKASLCDVLGHKYKVNLSVSNQLAAVTDSIELSTGIRIHGLLGTDFLKEYKYVIDFKALEVYPQK